jgi:hypothetical protein
MTQVLTFVKKALIGASVIALTACATATPYKAASKPGGFDGFSQTMIENDRARVTFGGNSLTERDTVENYLLYRAAEMAVERGFEYFELQERETEEKKRVNVSPRFGSSLYDPYFGYSFYRPRYGWSNAYRFSRFRGFRRGYGFGHRSAFYDPFYDPFFSDYDVREVTKYRASAEVKFGRGAKPAGKDHAFNAREVLQNLGPSITFPEEKA